MDKVQIYQELERRGELGKLPPEKQAIWAEYKRRQSSSAPAETPGQRVWNSFKENIADLTYAPRKALSGATLGASDWALRKLGVGYEDTENRMGEVSPLAKGLTKVGGFGAELGGNIGGLGGGLVKALAGKGLKGLKLGMASGGIEGLVTGATGSDTLSELPKNVALGGLIGTGGGAVGEGLTYLARPFSARSLTKGMKGGLNNVVENPEAVKLLNQGIKQSDDVASEFLLKSRPVARGINKDTANMVDSALTSRIDVPETIKDANARYGKYMDEHGEDEVFDMSLRKEVPNSKIFGTVAPDNTPVEMINIEDTTPEFEKASGLRKWLYKKFGEMKDVKVSSTDEKVDFSNGGARRVLKTVRDKDSTMYYPHLDEIVRRGQPSGTRLTDLEHANSVTGQNIYHTGIKYDGTPYSFEFYVDQPIGLGNRNFAGNKVKKIQRSDIDVGFLGHTDTPTPDNYTLADLRGNVNSKLPHISSLYDGLTKFQSNRLDDAMKLGFSKTNAKRGSLESLNKVKQEINEQIKKAMSTEKPSEVWQLEELKHKFDNAMPEGLKVVDKGYERAKRLENAFERGTHYNPNNVEGSDYISELSPLEQNAFAQGLFKRINNNSLTGKNLANTALGYENTLASVLRGDKYDDLMKGLNKQSTKFERLAGLGRKAESKLNTPEAQRFFGREQLESKGSMIGSALDWLNTKFRHDALERAGKNLLNPNYVGDSEAWLIENYPIIAGYLSSKLNQEVNQ